MSATTTATAAETKRWIRWLSKLPPPDADVLPRPRTVRVVVSYWEEKLKSLVLHTHAFHDNSELAEHIVRWLFSQVGRAPPPTGDWCAILRSLWFFHADLAMVCSRYAEDHLQSAMATYEQQRRTLEAAMHMWEEGEPDYVLRWRFDQMQVLFRHSHPIPVVNPLPPTGKATRDRLIDRHLAILDGDDVDAREPLEGLVDLAD